MSNNREINVLKIKDGAKYQISSHEGPISTDVTFFYENLKDERGNPLKEFNAHNEYGEIKRVKVGETIDWLTKKPYESKVLKMRFVNSKDKNIVVVKMAVFNKVLSDGNAQLLHDTEKYKQAYESFLENRELQQQLEEKKKEEIMKKLLKDEEMQKLLEEKEELQKELEKVKKAKNNKNNLNNDITNDSK